MELISAYLTGILMSGLVAGVVVWGIIEFYIFETGPIIANKYSKIYYLKVGLKVIVQLFLIGLFIVASSILSGWVFTNICSYLTSLDLPTL